MRDAYATANIMQALFSKTDQLNIQLNSMFNVLLPERLQFHTAGPWTSGAVLDTEINEEVALEKALGEGALTLMLRNSRQTPEESIVPYFL